MSGKTAFNTPPGGTTSTPSCRSDHKCTRRLPNLGEWRPSATLLIDTCSSTWTTFYYSRKPWKNTSPMSVSSSSDCWRIASLPRRISANFTVPLSNFPRLRGGPEGELEMDPAKTEAEWCLGRHRPIGRSFNDSLDSPTFTAGLSVGSVPRFSLWQRLPLPRSRSSGHPKPKPPSPLSRLGSPQPPILIMPKPEEQFILEVDALRYWRGGLYCPSRPPNGKVHPCVYFSHRLSPAGRNYAVGDRELLALKTCSGGVPSSPGGFDGPLLRLDGPLQPGVSPVG